MDISGSSHYRCHQRRDLCKVFASSPQASKSLKSQPKKAATQLLPASEINNLGKTDAKSGDSDLLVSLLNDLVAGKTLDPMEVGEFLHSCTYLRILDHG
jgi:ubiquitin carboxyl-terminal hydrolase 16/45